MANSTTNIDGVVQSQASKEVTINAYFDAASPSTLYGRRQSTTTGLTFGYYGGNVTKSDGTLAQISNGTLALTASTTNYIVAQKSDGVVSTATTTTNWNDTANFWRLYAVVTGGTTISSYTDYREIGKMTGAGGSGAASSVSPVTKTTAFTLGANENEVIVNGTASITVTLPAASAFVGRVVRFKNRAAFTLISASSNVKPIGTDTAGTAILPALAGRWAVIVSDGTNWVVMAQGADDAEFGAPPAIKTTAFTVADGESVFIVNGSASITATLPAAATYAGRRIRLKTIAAFPVISASSNVKPINSDTAGTAILRGIAGSWAVLVSDGTNWIVTERGGDDTQFLAPVTKTGDFTVADGENKVVCNGTATINVTLPAAASFPGRTITIKTIAAFTVVSVASNVVPLDSGTAGTAILAATTGKYAQLTSDGTNWVIMMGN
jgi:hypothetical protein